MVVEQNEVELNVDDLRVCPTEHQVPGRGICFPTSGKFCCGCKYITQGFPSPLRDSDEGRRCWMPCICITLCNMINQRSWFIKPFPTLSGETNKNICQEMLAGMLVFSETNTNEKTMIGSVPAINFMIVFYRIRIEANSLLKSIGH